MLFNSLPFLVFLLVVWPAWRLLPRPARNPLLLGASWFFYAWWDWRFLGLLLLSTLVDFWVGLALHRARTDRTRRRLLLASVAVNLAVLGTFKYLDFFLASAAALLEGLGLPAHLPALRVILPVGISFYTFQTMSYTIDIYRGRLVPTRDPVRFALFVAFFPQLVAGPIERAANLLPQLDQGRLPRREELAQGLGLITMGLAWKVLLGDRLAPLAEPAFADPAGASAAALLRGLVLFSLQIYCDFAGYSLIARGTARLFGVEVMVNFRQPYLAVNITDFWRRWHISLSGWLRDYLYIPLGGNRKGTARTYFNLLLTMLLGGLWHGASWTFVAWGALHGLFLAAHKLLLRGRPAAAGPDLRSPARALASLGAMAATFVLVLATWLFFRSPDFATAAAMLAGIASGRGFLDGPVLLQTGLVLGLVLAVDGISRATGREELLSLLPRPLRPAVIGGLWIVLFAHLWCGGEMPFIYFQF